MHSGSRYGSGCSWSSSPGEQVYKAMDLHAASELGPDSSAAWKPMFSGMLQLTGASGQLRLPAEGDIVPWHSQAPLVWLSTCWQDTGGLLSAASFSPFGQTVFAFVTSLFGSHRGTVSRRILWKASCLVFVFWQMLKLSCCLYYRDTINILLSEPLHVPVKFYHLPCEQTDSTTLILKKRISEISHVRFSNIMEMWPFSWVYILQTKMIRKLPQLE